MAGRRERNGLPLFSTAFFFSFEAHVHSTDIDLLIHKMREHGQRAFFIFYGGQF